ncbi:MAG TPA: CHAD domain-containing protein [Humisphaera sp.]
MPRKPAKKKRREFPLLDHVDGLMAKLHELTPAALGDFDAEAVHQARVATRRLTAAADLMKPVLSKRHRKPLTDGLKRLRRRLGPLRDADVLVDHLCELRKEPKHADAAGWLLDRARADRDRLRAGSKDGPSAQKELRRVEGWPLVRAEIVEAREAVDTLLAESLHLQTDAFAEQADRLVADHTGSADAAADDDQGGLQGAGAEGDAVTADHAAVPTPAPRQNPHDLRIAGKALRYTLEMAEVEGHSPGAAVMKLFKRMQELLGTWHDLVVLADRALLAVAESQLAHHDAAAAERAIELGKHAVRRSSQELSAFVKLWQQQGQKLAQRIRSAFPLTQAVAVPAAAGRDAATASAEPDADGDGGEAEPNAAADGEADVSGSRTGPGPTGSATLEVPAADP